MKIAILGWGSLIWDEGDVPLPLETGWQVGGPKLPIEFSRISNSRNGALTLVIDPDNGEYISTQFAISKRSDLDDAICDLRTREGTLVKRIGYVNLIDGSQRCNVYLNVGDIIRMWANNKNIDAVVWTDLPPNFEEFSVDKAIGYLHNHLSSDGATKAREYIRKAPKDTDTPLRRRLTDDPWLNL
jgi:hypothetical protein